MRSEVEKWRRGESPGTQRVLYPNTGSESQKVQNGPKPQVDAARGLLCILVVLMTVCVRFLFARWGGVKPSPSYTRGVRTCFSQVAWCEGNNCAHDAE